jgi:hypothetical protein
VIQIEVAIAQKDNLSGRRRFCLIVESGPIRSVLATLDGAAGTASICGEATSRASGAGALTLQWGAAIIMIGKKAAMLMPQAHVKCRVAADERMSSRVTTQVIPNGKLARRPHTIKSKAMLEPDVIYSPCVPLQSSG